MAISMYEASVPVMTQGLDSLARILEKTKAHCKEHKIDESALMAFRFYPDMYSLSKQVQTACDMAVLGVSRLLGKELEKLEDRAVGLDDLLARIAATLRILSDVKAEDLAGSDKNTISFTAMNAFTMSFPSGQVYLQKFVLPNLYFHCVTTYDMLRHNGVVLGKSDYLGDFGGTITPL